MAAARIAHVRSVKIVSAFFCRQLSHDYNERQARNFGLAGKTTVMGKKKNKKSFYKKQLKPFLKGNRVLIAALGGAAAGITLSNILGTERAQNVLHTVENSIQEFSDKVAGTSRGGKQNARPTAPERKTEAHVPTS